MMQWFGRSWGAPINAECARCATPVGEPCLHCGELIVDGDQGIVIPHCGNNTITRAPLHCDCHIRMIVGSIGHQLGVCSCKGGNLEDPPEMSTREAARFAADHFRTHGKR